MHAAATGITPWVWGLTLLVIGSGLSACGSSHHPAVEARQGRGVVATEPVSTAGAHRFTLPVGTDLQGLGQKYGVLQSSSSAGPSTFRGDRSGLYAASRKGAPCDASKLSRLLQQNPTAAAAWASTLGISTAQIPAYLASLTPVVLRVDTRVTNHGFVNGVSTPAQAVLQAGTSVLVDKYGQPVTKCYCGNPLTSPVLSSYSTYSGTEWSGFSAGRTAVILRSSKVIRTFTLSDPQTGQTFRRAAGSEISSGATSPVTSSSTSTSSTTVQPSTTSTVSEPGASSTATGGQASATSASTTRSR